MTRRRVYGHMRTAKSPDETRRDMRVVFRKWGVEDFDIIPPDRSGSLAHVAKVEYWIEGTKQHLSCQSEPYYHDNLRSILLLLDSLRLAAERGMMPELARAAMAMLPAGPHYRAPHDVLGIAVSAPVEVAEAAYKVLARTRHPDAGGSHEAMRELNEAIEAIRAEPK